MDQETYDTIVIGCGISGASTAYHLSVQQNQKVLVLEKGPLYVTGGSTSHAPGGCLPYNLGNRLMTRWGLYSTELYILLDCYYKTGSILLAKSDARLQQFDLEIKSSREDGVPVQHLPRLVDNKEILTAHPDIDLVNSGVKGGILYPTAGRADAIQAIMKMCQAAVYVGARVVGNTEVSQIVFDSSGNVVGVRIKGNTKVVKARNVVIAAGAWGRNLFPLPVSNIEHQWILLENKGSDLKGKNRHQDLNTTTVGLFDFDGGIYYHQFGDLIGIGSYAHKGLIVPDSAMTTLNVAEHPFTPNDYIKAKNLSEELFPHLKTKKAITSFNGFMTFTKDGYPLVGPITNHPGLWTIECIWVTHGPGAGRTLAEWISKGKPSEDELPYIPTVSPQRFPAELGQSTTIYEVQQLAQSLHHNRCALPNFDLVLKNRSTKPKIPFIKARL